MSYGSRRLRDYSRTSGFVQTIPVFPDNAVSWTMYYGPSTTNTNFTSTQIQALSTQAISSITGVTVTLTGVSGKYVVLAVPRYFGTPTSITVNGTITVLPTGGTLELNVNNVLVEYIIYVSATTQP